MLDGSDETIHDDVKPDDKALSAANGVNDIPEATAARQAVPETATTEQPTLAVDGIEPNDAGADTGLDDEFSRESPTDRIRIQTYIAALTAAIDTFLKKSSNESEIFNVLYTPILTYMDNGVSRIVNGATVVAYIIFSDMITSLDELRLDEEIDFTFSLYKIEQAIEELKNMDESERKLYALHASNLFK